ncbi:MAG: hypothetical protein AAGF24_01695 [Cyanobacteria bacterium P01_H01_bin.121]
MKVLTDLNQSELRRVSDAELWQLNQKLAIPASQKPLTPHSQGIYGSSFKVTVNPLGQVGTKVQLGRVSPRAKTQRAAMSFDNTLPTSQQQLQAIADLVNQVSNDSPQLNQQLNQQLNALIKLLTPVVAIYLNQWLVGSVPQNGQSVAGSLPAIAYSTPRTTKTQPPYSLAA